MGVGVYRILAELDLLALEFRTIEFSDSIGDVIGRFEINNPEYQKVFKHESTPFHCGRHQHT